MNKIYYQGETHLYPGICYYTIIRKLSDNSLFEDAQDRTVIVLHHPIASGISLINSTEARNEVINRIIQTDLPSAPFPNILVVYNLHPENEHTPRFIFGLDYSAAFQNAKEILTSNLTFSKTGIYLPTTNHGCISKSQWAVILSELQKQIEAEEEVKLKLLSSEGLA